eukprot:8265039-Alexandrium_andersonii.AAC.1
MVRVSLLWARARLLPETNSSTVQDLEGAGVVARRRQEILLGVDESLHRVRAQEVGHRDLDVAPHD